MKQKSLSLLNHYAKFFCAEYDRTGNFKTHENCTEVDLHNALEELL